MGYLLGIDGGGSKTACALADSADRLVSRAEGPGTNLGRTSADELHLILEDLRAELMRDAALDRLDCDCVCAGFAGASDPVRRATAERILQELFRPSLLRVVGDMEIALEAAAGDGPGIVLIAGTGSICFGRGAGGATARAGGLGVASGDPGSGYAVGSAAVAALAEGRADPDLARVLREYLGEGPVPDLPVERMGNDASRLAALAPAVQRAFEEGSTAAAAILDEAGRNLANLVFDVSGQLDPAGNDWQVVLTGGAFRACPELRRVAQAALHERMPAMTISQLETAPVEGAVLMARRIWRNRSTAP